MSTIYSLYGLLISSYLDDWSDEASWLGPNSLALRTKWFFLPEVGMNELKPKKMLGKGNVNPKNIVNVCIIVIRHVICQQGLNYHWSNFVPLTTLNHVFVLCALYSFLFAIFKYNKFVFFPLSTEQSTGLAIFTGKSNPGCILWRYFAAASTRFLSEPLCWCRIFFFWFFVLFRFSFSSVCWCHLRTIRCSVTGLILSRWIY